MLKIDVEEVNGGVDESAQFWMIPQTHPLLFESGWNAYGEVIEGAEDDYESLRDPPPFRGLGPDGHQRRL